MSLHYRHYCLAALFAVILILTGCAPASPAQVAAPTDEPPSEAGTEASAEPPQAQPAAPQSNLTEGCIDSYAEGVDYFPDKVAVEYAQSFTVEYHESYKLVTVLTPWPGAEQPFQYVLVQCGTPAPDGYPDATIVTVPATRTVMMSTAYLTNLDDLGMLDRLVGLDAFAYTNNPTVRQMIDEGGLTEIAPTGMEVNVEQTLDLEPDLIMAFSSGMPEYDLHPVLIEAGLPVVINGDWTEGTPLARAEYVKFMSLFFNAEARANDVFNEVVTEYNAAVELAASVTEKPVVMSGLPYEGTWNTPGGMSYTAQMFRDAGGDYVFADDPSVGTIFLDFEAVFEQAHDADLWVNVSGHEALADLLATDPRFGEFRPFQEGRVWADDGHSTSMGTELYETGVAHPHLVLLDLIKIFHPDLLPDHELYYYRLLE